MAKAVQLDHKILRNTALPYDVSGNPLDPEPAYIAGQNVLTSFKKFAERRPGFSPFETTATIFSTQPHRISTWNRFAGSFFVMLSVGGVSTSEVYKLEVGTDSSFVLIHTDTGSSTPFDFIAANNHVFFGNGNEMKKYDGTSVTNWGIAKPTAAPTVAVNATLNTGWQSPSSGTGANWTNPGNVFASDDNRAVYNDVSQDDLRILGFSLAIPSGATIVGIEVEVEGNGDSATAAQRQIRLGLTKDGSTLVGTRKTAVQLNQTTDTTITEGGASDLWGGTWTKAELEAAAFGVLLGDNDSTAAGLNIDRVRVRITFSSLTPTAGFKYVAAYGNSTTGHISSESARSLSTGVFTTSVVDVTLVASTDAQVDEIHVYRSTDGGGGVLFEIPGSPYTNTNQTIQDATDDADLVSTLSPGETLNDRPPGAQGFVWYANRLWMFTANLVWYTGWEEIVNGVEEESVPSGNAGNFWAFEAEVHGLSVVDDAVLVFTAGAIHRIEGDTRDTFSRRYFVTRLGCRNHATITRMGRLTAWLDPSDSVYVTDGVDIQKVSRPVDNDLKGIDHSLASATFHNDAQQQWLLLLDGEDGLVRVYDFETEQWMTPWTLGGNFIFSGETASGTYDLLIAHNLGKVLKLDSTVFQDDSVSYNADVTTNLVDVAPSQKPGMVSSLWYLGYETDSNPPSVVRAVIDDDPSVASPAFVDAGNIVDVPLRKKGVTIQERRAHFTKPNARRVSVRLDWAKDGNNFALYSLDFAINVRDA